jgi:argininosuccinate lyase
MSNVNIPFEAITKLVGYLEHDERKHFEDMRDDGEDTNGHIYHSVKAVADWLGTQGVSYRNAHEVMMDAVAAAFAKHGVTVDDAN